MSPRRRLLVAVVVALLLVGVGVVGVRLLSAPAPSIDPVARPAQDRPGPVLLVPGYGGSRGGLQQLAARIEATGRSATVLTLIGDGTGDLSAQVAVLDAALDAALATGAPSVDVVGYSAGGVVAGLWVARDACPAACRQLAPGSAEITELTRNRVGEALPWLSVWTADDETVTPPGAASALAGTTQLQVQAVCPGARVTHSALPTDPAVTGVVLRALSPDPLDAAVTGVDCAELRAAG